MLAETRRLLHLKGRDITFSTTTPSANSLADGDILFVNSKGRGRNLRLYTKHLSKLWYVPLVNISNADLVGDLVDTDSVQTLKNKSLSAPLFPGNVSIGGYLLEGRTVIKIPPTSFTSNDDHYYNNAVIEDDTGNYGVRVSNVSAELYTWVDVPLGYTATKVQINGSDTDNEVYVYTLDLDDGTISSQISNSGDDQLTVGEDTDLDTPHVGADDKMLLIGVGLNAANDLVYGGYVTIQKT